MSNSLFNLLCEMESADIARNLIPFLRNNEFPSVLPDDEKILQEVFSDPPITPTQLANQINQIAIELVKAYLELNVVDFNNQEHVKKLIVYEENYNETDASKSAFSITVLGLCWNAPNEDDLSEIIDTIQWYEIAFLNNGLFSHKMLSIYLDEITLSKVEAVDSRILVQPFNYGAKPCYLVSLLDNPKGKEIIDIIYESNPERFEKVSPKEYAFLLLCKIA